MIKPILTVWFLALFALPVFSNHIVIQTVKKEAVSSLPGKAITVVLKVTNNTSSEVMLEPKSSLPQSWVALGRIVEIKIAAHSNQLILFSFLIPGIEAPGAYFLKYSVSDKSNPDKQYSTEVPVEVLEVNKVAAEPLEIPNFTIAGREFNARFVVRNLSNSSHTILLKTVNCTAIDGNSIDLSPQESKVIEVVSRTFPDLVKESRHMLWLEARLEADKEVVAYASQYINVFPRENMKLRIGRELPVNVRLQFLGRTLPDSTFVSGYQVDISAQGSLDAAGEKQIEIGLRGPARTTSPHWACTKNITPVIKRLIFMCTLGTKPFNCHD